LDENEAYREFSIKQAKADEREQCCKDVCYYCKLYPAEQLPDGTWVHDTGPTTTVQCHAELIRERAFKSQSSPPAAPSES